MRHFYLLIIACVFQLHTLVHAQTNATDSLALVDFYLATNGPDWNNNTNWLSTEPVSTWEGITVSDIQGDFRVTEIALNGNNVQGAIPSSIGNLIFIDEISLFDNQVLSFPEVNTINPQTIDLGSNLLTQLPSFSGYSNTQDLLVDNNQLSSLPDLLNLPSLGTFWVQDNQLTFVDLLQGIQFQIPDFQYSPQAPFAMEARYLKQGNEVAICNIFPDFSAGLTYQWFDDEGVPVTSPSSSPCLTVDASGAESTGSFVLAVVSNQVQNLTLIATLDVTILFEEEPGSCYNPLEFIVQFQPGASQENIDILENALIEEGASKVKECQCGEVLQLWTAPTVTEVEGRKSTAEDQLDVDTTGNNYSLFIILAQESGGTVNPYSGPNSDGVPDPNIRVGIIDTGIGPDISLTQDAMWNNVNELATPGADDDGNCLIDEIEGYDFQNNTNQVVDGSIHGSHVSGIVARDFPADLALEMMDLRVHDGEIGFLFDAACAIYLGIQNDAKVINNSWGYYGSTISPILDEALLDALDNDIVLVCSAGNGLEGTPIDTDAFPHWPSNADYPNIISVAALENLNDNLPQLAFYSNFGFNTVDLAAEGTDIESTVPFNNTAVFSGTSMAAADVTRTAAIIRGRDSDYSAAEVVNCILSTTEFDANLDGLVRTGGFLNSSEAILACAPTSIADLNYGQLEVLPNPFTDQVGIRLPEDQIQADADLQIFDASGKLVFQQSSSFQSILIWNGRSLSGDPVPSGFYMYHLTIGDQLFTGKLIRNR